MVPLNLTAGALARAMGLKDRTRIERVSREAQPITADTALRLGRVFDTSAQFWLNLQTQHDLSAAAIATREELSMLRPLVEARPFEEPSAASRPALPRARGDVSEPRSKSPATFKSRLKGEWKAP